MRSNFTYFDKLKKGQQTFEARGASGLLVRLRSGEVLPRLERRLSAFSARAFVAYPRGGEVTVAIKPERSLARETGWNAYVARQVRRIGQVEYLEPLLLDEFGSTRAVFFDQATLRLEPGADPNRLPRELVSTVRPHQVPEIFSVALPPGIDGESAIARFNEVPWIRYAGPLEIAIDDRITRVGLGPLLDRRRPLNRGERIDQALERVRAVEGLRFLVEERGLADDQLARAVVAVVDSRVDVSHFDLRDNLVADFDRKQWRFGVAGVLSQSRSIHGTSVAGTIVAGANGRGSRGVAPVARVLPVEVGLRLAGEYADRAAAIEAAARWASQPEQRHLRMVINCS